MRNDIVLWKFHAKNEPQEMNGYQLLEKLLYNSQRQQRAEETFERVHLQTSDTVTIIIGIKQHALVGRITPMFFL